MNYNKIYESLINRCIGREREIGVYYERHHILPKCIGGLDNEENLVYLTYREHFVAHWLLHNIYPENKQLHSTFNFMSYGKWGIKTNTTIVSSKILEKRKMEQIKTFSSDAHKQKIKDAWAQKKANNEFNLINIDPDIIFINEGYITTRTCNIVQDSKNKNRYDFIYS